MEFLEQIAHSSTMDLVANITLGIIIFLLWFLLNAFSIHILSYLEENHTETKKAYFSFPIISLRGFLFVIYFLPAFIVIGCICLSYIVSAGKNIFLGLLTSHLGIIIFFIVIISLYFNIPWHYYALSLIGFIIWCTCAQIIHDNKKLTDYLPAWIQDSEEKT